MPDSKRESPGSNTSGIGDRGSGFSQTRITNNELRRREMKEGLGFIMGVNLIIWFGIAFYLFILDRRIKRLEESGKNKNE